MGRFVAWLYEYTHQRRWVWAVLTLLLAGLSLWKATGLHISTDLFDALPQDDAVQRYRTLQSTAGGADRIVIGFTVSDPILFDSAVASADRTVALLSADTARIVTAFCRPDPAMGEAMLDMILDHVPQFTDDNALHRLAVLDSVQVDSTIAAALRELSGPMSMLAEKRLLKDPFGLTASHLLALEHAGDFGGAVIIDGVLASADSTTVFAMVNAAPDAGNSIVGRIDQLLARAAAPQVGTAQFGTLPMNAVNAGRIAKDSTWTLLVALAIMFALLLARYRRVIVPLTFFLPPLIGSAFALGAMALLREELSGLALGGTAALLGIALDYSFHFFTHLQHRRDVALTLREIAPPLLLGFATTALAFLGLTFLGTPVLADLGLLAAFTLAGAAFTLLFVLPHFAVVPQPRRSPTPASPDLLAGWRASLRRWALPAVAVITIALLPFVNDVRFEDDPEKLSWMPDNMRALRDRLQGRAGTLSTVFVTAQGATADEVRRGLETAKAELGQRRLLPPGQALFPTDLSPSTTVLQERVERWKATLDKGHAEQLARWIRNSAIAHGFLPDAFDAFTDQLTQAPDLPANGSPGMVEPFGAALRDSAGVTMSAILRLPQEDVRLVEMALQGEAGIAVLHRGVLGARLKALAGNDLGRILLYTSLLVFFALLIHHGRIEPALLTFTPMALGWLWILGFCGLTGIAFNMVNIIVCTFIFGLGDDYCIFTSEGLQARYRTGVDHTGSFRGAVVLSAITTLIGTGVMVFAQHPALRSIGVLSVAGMVALLVISLTVQPALFRMFISGRTAKGHPPFTLLSFFISLFAFSYFLLGCVVLLATWSIFRLTPIARRLKQRTVRHLLMLFTRSLVYVMVNTRKDIRSFRGAIALRPSIVIANHSSFIDILCMLMISPRVVMMTNRWVWNSPFFGAIVRTAGFLRTEDPVEVNVARARAAMAEGLSIIIFPEGTRSRDGHIGRFHKGAFHLAEQLKAPIVPVVLHGVGYAMRKGDPLLKNALLTMRTLGPVDYDDPRFGTGTSERTRRFTAWFRERFEEVRSPRETPVYFNEQLHRTFLYKGPVLEWYTRIKSRMDILLHELIHARIAPGARVTDLGCGHGMVAYLLHWSGPHRTVLGVDHDGEKIAIASNGFSRGTGLSFAQADLEHFTPPSSDAFILKDVLHYLRPDAQRALLLRCSDALAPGGQLFVRDGFAGDARRHDRTRLSEFFSVGLGFNRSKQELHFPAKGELEQLAREAGLTIEWAITGGSTSNELAILHKPAAPSAHQA